MNGLEFINQNISKKMGISIVTLVLLERASAPPWCLVLVGSVAIIAQCVLDYKGEKHEKVSVSVSGDVVDDGGG